MLGGCPTGASDVWCSGADEFITSPEVLEFSGSSSARGLNSGAVASVDLLRWFASCAPPEGSAVLPPDSAGDACAVVVSLDWSKFPLPASTQIGNELPNAGRS